MNDTTGKLAPRGTGGWRRSRIDGSLAIWAFAIVALSAMVVTAGAEDRTSQPPENRLRPGTSSQVSTVPQESPISADDPLVREGEVWHNELGHIFLTGSRYAFRPVQGGRSVIVLENLNLQRVVQRLDETPQAPIWSISGVITEFQGSNYLLIERAVRKGQASLQAVGQR